MTSPRFVKFLDTGLNDQLVHDLVARSIVHTVSPDGTVSTDHSSAAIMADIVGEILRREVGDYDACWIASDGDRARWRSKIAREGFRLIELSLDGELYFVLNQNHLAKLGIWADSIGI